MTALILPFEVPDSAYYQRHARASDIAKWNPHSNAPTGTCQWCGEEIDRNIPEDKRRRNWHTKCLPLHNALYWDPRTEAMKRDHGVCLGCGRDCDDADRRIRALWARFANTRRPTIEKIRALRAMDRLMKCYSYPIVFGSAKSIWEAHHIISVEDGGGWPLGPGNIQTLCFRCHKVKTHG